MDVRLAAISFPECNGDQTIMRWGGQQGYPGALPRVRTVIQTDLLCQSYHQHVTRVYISICIKGKTYIYIYSVYFTNIIPP